MKCPVCGNLIEKGAKECAVCGTEVTKIKTQKEAAKKPGVGKKGLVIIAGILTLGLMALRIFIMFAYSADCLSMLSGTTGFGSPKALYSLTLIFSLLLLTGYVFLIVAEILILVGAKQGKKLMPYLGLVGLIFHSCYVGLAIIHHSWAMAATNEPDVFFTLVFFTMLFLPAIHILLTIAAFGKELTLKPKAHLTPASETQNQESDEMVEEAPALEEAEETEE